MSIGIILPTVSRRRSGIYQQALDAYRETTKNVEVEILTPLDYPSVSEAWNAGARSLVGDHDYLHFGIDDQLPDAGWWETAVETIENTDRLDWGRGFLPAADQRYPDGKHDAHGGLGFAASLGKEAPDWTPCRSTGVIFCSADQWVEIGEFLEGIHHFCDDDWYWRAATKGYRVVYRAGYAFVHHHLKIGHVLEQTFNHRDLFVANATRLGPVPTREPISQETT